MEDAVEDGAHLVVDGGDALLDRGDDVVLGLVLLDDLGGDLRLERLDELAGARGLARVADHGPVDAEDLVDDLGAVEGRRNRRRGRRLEGGDLA